MAIPDKEAETVAQAIFDTWITRYSTPFEILSDQGKEFCNNLFKSLCQKLSILLKTTSPYHPETNASAEVFNRTMKRYLQAVLQPPYLDWESYLPSLRFCYNTSISKATHASPFSLIFGMNPRMPFFELEKYINYDESSASDNLARLHLARNTAREINLQYKDNYEKAFNKQYNTEARSFSPGDSIFLRVSPD